MNDTVSLHKTTNARGNAAISASPAKQPARQLPNRNTRLGAYGEALACEYLKGHGYRVLARNWRNGRAGELDIIAFHEHTIVAVEVKTRGGTGYGHPLEAVTTLKAKRLRRLLFAWVRSHKPGAQKLRVDAIGIVLKPGTQPRLMHLRGVA